MRKFVPVNLAPAHTKDKRVCIDDVDLVDVIDPDAVVGVEVTIVFIRLVCVVLRQACADARDAENHRKRKQPGKRRAQTGRLFTLQFPPIDLSPRQAVASIFSTMV